jgi:hypothetical protein
MDNLSKFDRTMQDRQLTERAFDLFEHPMQKWTADMLGVEQSAIFQRAPQDNLIFEEHGRRWVLELIPFKPTAECPAVALYDIAFWKENRSSKYESAIKMVLQAVPKIYIAFGLMIKNDYLRYFIPQLDVRNMCFFWTAQNPEEQKNIHLFVTQRNMREELSKLPENSDEKEKMAAKIAEIGDELKKINFAEIERADAFIRANETAILAKPRLYIRLREMNAADREILLARVASSGGGSKKYSDC